MSPDPLGEPDPPRVLPCYPHMLFEDCAVWSRWLAANAHRLTGVWYDVHVGRPMAVPPDLQPLMIDVAAAVSRKRIDVVARTPTERWVIEVKPYGNYTALGQAVVYSRLFSLEHPGGLPVVPMVVCAQIDPDLPDDYARLHVRVEEVGYA